MAYEAKNLNEIADTFEVFASDQEALNARNYGNQREQRDRKTAARIWRDAAKMLRETTLTGDAAG